MSSNPELAAVPAVRKLAEEQARDLYAAAGGLALDWDYYIDPQGRGEYTRATTALLSDLSRPASRDALARLVAEALGMECNATAPSFYWSALAHDSTDCDGAPNGDGWPSGWWLANDAGDLRFFTAEDWSPDKDATTTVLGLPDGEENATSALSLVALHALGGAS